MANARFDFDGIPEALPGAAAPRSVPVRPEPEVANGGPDGAIRRKPPERKVVTVLFADIVESSSMVSGRDPEEADQTLLGILQILTDGVARYGGTIAQMLGDGMMAVFGAPAAMEDHALRACLAAQDIARAAIDSADFKVRVGISSGEVVAQVVESGVWTDYRTVGETVHVAAKLQQRAEPNSVLLSHATLALVPTGLTARPAGTLRLSATAEPVAAHALESARAIRRTAMDMLSSDANLFVGRHAELAELTEALHHARDGEGAFILLSGEAGIGKSRLTSELTRSPAACGFGTLYWPQFPIRRLGEPDDLEAVASSLAALVGGTAIGTADRVAVVAVAAAAERNGGELAGEAVKELLGVPSVHPTWITLDAAQKVEFAIEGLVAAIRDLSADRPLLILVEDAHWTRGLTNRLLDALCEALDDVPVLAIATSRPDTRGGWTAPEHVRHIALEPLEPIQADEFLDHWLGHNPALANLKERVATQSQGVPLYLEESLRTLESSGAIVGSPGRYEIGKSDATVILPTTVHGLLASRIDAIDPVARRVLLHAAVIGTSVDLELLRQVSPVPTAELPPILARLEEDGFLARSRLMPNLAVTFRHALVQEVAYATLTKRDRQPLHGRVLRALRLRRDRSLPNRAELMAHHAYFAEQWALACAYGRRAGRRAETRCKHFDAERFYENALKALDHLPQTRRNTQRRIDLLIAIPLVILPQGRPLPGSHLTTARDFALGIDDRFRYARATSLMASFKWVYGTLDEAVELSKSALDHLGAGGSVELRIQVLARLGGMLGDKGDFPEALEKLEEARSLALDYNAFARFGLAVVATVISACHQGRCLAELGRNQDAVRAARRALDSAEQAGHAFSISTSKMYLALTHITGGQFDAALPLLKDAVTITEAIRLHIYQPLTLGALGYAIARTGSVEEGSRLLHASLEQARMLNHSLPKPRILNWMSELAVETGQAQAAVAYAEEALAVARDIQQPPEQAWAHLSLARALFASSRHEDALHHLGVAEGMGERMLMRPLVARCRGCRQDSRALNGDP
ncbi:ATP-binding protein [Azospirillum canadense]|uniref:ATP-binding protein n=1 Tax=Azospirillum canadense TaxID=403962 RepID=UPI0022277BF9|nr:adenylate/guanylate cyclase domain-containing protein [Azospirillum canadense]MCW2243772.1 class 3 adenylate cyclase/tetratricopeptide (TPR) repeat protein [Azospirillum canadense]